MVTPCQSCGKKETVSINSKRYCANCGEVVYDRAPDLAALAGAVKKTAARATPKAPAKTPKGAKRQAGHLLDLSHLKSKAQAYRPAQAVHGNRRAASRTAAPAKSSLAANRRSKAQARHQRALAAARSQRVQKFPPVAKPAPAPKPALPPKPMAPNRVYQINGGNPTPKVRVAGKPKANIFNLKTFIKTLREDWRFFGKHRHWVPVTAVTLVVLLMAGYLTYLNVPSVALRIAASRAGIEAQLPNYRPPGYSLSGLVNYSRGQVTVRFAGSADQGHLDLTQRKSDWDPQTLLENYVLPKSPNPIPYRQNGLTVYVYGGNNAAWINNGMFFTIEGDTQLDQEQVLKMAASL